MPEPIVIENLSKYYNKFLAVDSLSLSVTENSNVGLLGPNGAGKSTTLKIMCGLIRASSGTVYIDGISVSEKPVQALSRIGAIIETPEFYTYLTPEETLSYLGRLRGMNGDELRQRIAEVIRLVRLEEWSAVRIEKFSRGMKQRLALAQTLLHDPPVLILDEPALGLDPRGVVEFRELIEEVGREKTVFFASHQLVEVAQICEEVAIIDRGHLLAYDKITQLEEKYQSLESAYLQLTGEVL
ncbi:MAG: ABC transporter ATP-binding protein [Dehalococcoidales bacterium]|nr:MAG: ABC transporter ATP-binding protein [Dehalococcoidales bacterium]